MYDKRIIIRVGKVTSLTKGVLRQKELPNNQALASLQSAWS
jgi:hypothetical protein